MSLDEIINPIYPLPADSLAKLKVIALEISLPKNHILIKAGKVESKLFLIKKGIVRAFATSEEHDITFWFGMEGDIAFSMKSFANRKPGYENIELLENSELFQIDDNELQKLFTEDIHIANWGRKLFENELIKTEERYISRQFKTASERYSELMENHKKLLQRVQLGHIASFLGISQVSLSRIRAEIR
jgi:CRP-like cAMP-binding protein